jgi:septum formation protein
MVLLLASASPRRRALLSQLVNDFDTVDPDIDESVLLNESPLDYVARLSVEKHSDMPRRTAPCWVPTPPSQ